MNQSDKATTVTGASNDIKWLQQEPVVKIQ